MVAARGLVSICGPRSGARRIVWKLRVAAERRDVGSAVGRVDRHVLRAGPVVVEHVAANVKISIIRGHDDF